MKYQHIFNHSNEEWIVIINQDEFKALYYKYSPRVWIKNDINPTFYHKIHWMHDAIKKEYNTFDEVLIDIPELILL